jgi:iron complex outermembrane receptor protein
MKHFSLVLLFIFGSRIVFAQAAIRGAVSDPQAKSVAGAEITLFSRTGAMESHTTTDSEGNYRFSSVAPGEYIVEAQATGFAAASAPVVARAGNGSALNFALKLAAISEQVVVTASASAQTAAETSKTITVVPRDAIEERDQYSLSEAVRQVPGLSVQQLGGPLAFTTFQMRGLGPQDTAVLIDGMRFRDATATQGDASGIIEDMVVTDVDRIEILRGVGSSLYGTNAIGGVVNVITDAGGGRTRGSVLLEGGSLGTFRGRGQLSGGLRSDRIQFSAGFSHLNVTSGVDGDDPARNTSGQGHVSFRLTPTARLTARVYSADTFLKLNSSPIEIGNLPTTGIVNAVPLPLSLVTQFENGTPVSSLPIGNANFIASPNDPDATRATRFFTGAVALEGDAFPRIAYTASYQAMLVHKSFDDGPAGVSFQPLGSTITGYDGRIHTVHTHVDFRLPRNLITAGYEFENENFNNKYQDFLDAAADSFVDVTQRSHNFFIQDQARLLGDRLQLSAAFRAQRFSLDQPQFLPAASAPYQGNPFTAPPTAYTGDGSVAYFIRKSGTKLHAHIGRGYRAPSLFERFGTGYDPLFGYSVYGDPRLQPERSLGGDAGIDQTFGNGRVRASAAYFYTRLEQTIVFDFSGLINPATDPFGRFGGYLNTSGGIARGVESSVNVAVMNSLNLSAGYTFTNSIDRVPLVSPVLQTFNVPPHVFSILARQQIGKRILLTIDFTASSSYLGELFTPNDLAYRFGGLRKADAAISYRLPLSEYGAVRFFAQTSNFLNQDYFQQGFRTPGITGMGGMRFEF